MANVSKKNKNILSGVGDESIGRNIKNLSTTIKSAKSKKPKLNKLKKLDLVKINSFGTDFLIFGAKKSFIHL